MGPGYSVSPEQLGTLPGFELLADKKWRLNGSYIGFNFEVYHILGLRVWMV